MYEKITPENVLMFAIRNYDNPHCEGEKEFEDDLKRFKYIKRLLRKYYDTGVLKERLILNHIIVLNNVFGPDACATLLVYKIQAEYWSALKSFLLFLNIIREEELNHIETDDNGIKVKRYNGMASKTAQKNWKGSYSSIEGVSSFVKYKGTVSEVVNEIMSNVRSGMSYSGARTLEELKDAAEMVIQTSASSAEGKPHIFNRE